jgi:hypothetical protein
MLRVTLLATVLLASAPSCPDLYSLATHGFSQPTVTNSGANATAVSGGIQVSIALSATNPNQFPITLDSVDYTVSMNDSQVFTGTQSGLTVGENSSGSLTVSGVVSSSQPGFQQLRPGQSVPYTIAGTAHFDSPAGVPVEVGFQVDGSVTVPSVVPASRP